MQHARLLICVAKTRMNKIVDCSRERKCNVHERKQKEKVCGSIVPNLIKTTEQTDYFVFLGGIMVLSERPQLGAALCCRRQNKHTNGFCFLSKLHISKTNLSLLLLKMCMNRLCKPNATNSTDSCIFFFIFFLLLELHYAITT